MQDDKNGIKETKPTLNLKACTCRNRRALKKPLTLVEQSNTWTLTWQITK